jgi:hypothetical protein
VVATLEVEQHACGGLKHLCLHSQPLLKSRQRGWRSVDILVIVPIVVLSVGVVAVPCVGHLKCKS